MIAKKCNTWFLVIFDIFTVKLAAAAECTEFSKLEGARAPMPHSKWLNHTSEMVGNQHFPKMVGVTGSPKVSESYKRHLLLSLTVP